MEQIVGLLAALVSASGSASDDSSPSITPNFVAALRSGVERMEALLLPLPSALPTEPRSLPTLKEPKPKLRYVPVVLCDSDFEAFPRFFKVNFEGDLKRSINPLTFESAIAKITKKLPKRIFSTNKSSIIFEVDCAAAGGLITSLSKWWMESIARLRR